MNLIQDALSKLPEFSSPAAVWEREQAELVALRSSQRRRRIHEALGTDDLMIEKFASHEGFEYLVTGGMVFEEEASSLPDGTDGMQPCWALYALGVREERSRDYRTFVSGSTHHTMRSTDTALAACRYRLWSHLDLPRILGENKDSSFEASIVLGALSTQNVRVDGKYRHLRDDDAF